MPNDNPIPHVFVPLSKNMVAIIDAEDAERVLPHKWCVRNRYASRCPKKGEPGFVSGNRCGGVIYLHQVIAGCPDGQEVDHINRNRLDDRRANLRCASRSQNVANRKPSRNATGFFGVQRFRTGFAAKLVCRRERKYLGYFKSAEEAALAYDAGARECFGDFATLNFPGAQ